MLRRILFWAHLCAGVAAAVVILIMCVTGIGLAFERQINQVADRASRASVTQGTARLPVAQLMESLPEGTRRLSAITVAADPKEPVAFAFGRERTLFVDPYNGKLLGRSSEASRAFFSWLERWHRTLGAELRGRGPGRAITGAANLIFLFLVLSGPFLWLPRKWSWRRIRTIAWFRRGLPWRAAFWNWHHVAGIWCAIPLFVIVLSGVVMSYAWANNLLYRAAGSDPPARTAQRQEPRSGAKRGHVEAVEWDALFQRAESQVQGWKTVSLRWPVSAEAVFTIDRGDGGQPEKRAQLTLDMKTGAVRKWEPFSSYSTGRQWRAWARFAHTGELGGVPGEFVAAVATAGGALLVLSGLGLTWLRVRAVAKPRRKTVEQRPDAVLT